jgi:integrase
MTALLDTMRAGGKAPGTIRNTEVKVGHLARLLGAGLDLRELEPPQGIARIAEYVRERVEEGAMRSTIAIEVSILKMALRVAARSGRYRGDTRVLSVVELRGAHRPRRSWAPPLEARQLIVATPPQWRDHVETYLGTGVRRMELYRIEASDIDRERNLVHVRGTKTERADRWLPMSPRVREILLARAEAHPAGPLFNEWTRAHNDLRAICERASIPRLSVSDLRRTFASLLLSAGVSPSVLKELLGHATTRQIDLVYGHASEESKQAAVMLNPLAGEGSRVSADGPGAGGTSGEKQHARREKKPRDY